MWLQSQPLLVTYTGTRSAECPDVRRERGTRRAWSRSGPLVNGAWSHCALLGVGPDVCARRRAQDCPCSQKLGECASFDASQRSSGKSGHPDMSSMRHCTSGSSKLWNRVQLVCVEVLRVVFQGARVELQRFCTKGNPDAGWFDAHEDAMPALPSFSP